MISGFLGIDPALVFFILLTTISLSLWFATCVIENSLYSFWHNLFVFVCSFLLSFLATTLFLFGIIDLFHISLRVL